MEKYFVVYFFALKDHCLFALCSCLTVPNDCWSGRWIIVLCEHGWSLYIQSHACQHDRWLFSQSDQMKSACFWIRQGVSMSARQVCFTDVFVSAYLQWEFSSSPSGGVLLEMHTQRKSHMWLAERISLLSCHMALGSYTCAHKWFHTLNLPLLDQFSFLMLVIVYW